MGPNADETRGAALTLGRALNSAQAEGLAIYLGLLERWNRATNLVGKRGWREILSDLAADSWHAADYFSGLDFPCDAKSPVIFDLGAGAGLPGLPLRLFFDAGVYYLIEPRRKRAAFLETAIVAMKLPRTFAIEARAEEALGRCPAPAGPADASISRAFLPWREYAALAARLVRPGGHIVVMASHGPPHLSEVEPNFGLGPSLAYETAGKKRYVWSLIPAKAPSAEF